MSDKYQYAQELSEDRNVKIDLGYSPGVDMSDANKRRINALLDKVFDKFIPEDEHVNHVELSVQPWRVAKVTVWCKSQGFDYSNSQVHDTKFMSDGKLYRAKVDVRPF